MNVMLFKRREIKMYCETAGKRYILKAWNGLILDCGNVFTKNVFTFVNKSMKSVVIVA